MPSPESYAWFSRLHPEIRRLLRERFRHFTPIQEKGIPRVLDGGHTLLIAPTGTGKTEAALIPVLSMALDPPSHPPCILYITPLRALNRDMLIRMEEMCTRLGLKVGVRHADTTPSERRRQVTDPPHLLITTPESAQILLYGKRLRRLLRHVRWLIVDEVHELFSSERGAQFSIVMERMDPGMQRIGLSATVAVPETLLRYLTGAGRGGAVVDVSEGTDVSMAVEVPDLPEAARLAERTGISPGEASILLRISEEVRPGRGVLMFVNTRRTAEHLAYLLRSFTSLRFALHHGSLSREVRMRAEEMFRAGEVGLLICTSSMELGVDIGSIDLVIQYGSPRQVTRMVQRVGRSGHRVGGRPRGVILSPGGLDAVESDVIAERTRSMDLEETPTRGASLAALANQVIAEVCASGTFRRSALLERVRNAYPYRGLDPREFDAVVDLLVRTGMLREVEGHISMSRRSRGYFVTTVSMIPDESRVRVRDAASGEVIGTLDESFAATLSDGETFIMHGQAREVISFEGGVLLTRQVTDSGRVPTWVGEEIPVSLKVAEEVLSRVSSGEGGRRGISLPEGINVSGSSWLIECRGREMVLILPLGSRGGDALAHLLGGRISHISGRATLIQGTPYGVVLKPPPGMTPHRVVDILREVQRPEAELESTLPRTHLYRYRFVQAARKFGILEAGADLKRRNIDALIRAYRSTPIHRDVLERILREDMDLDVLERRIDALRRGEVRVTCLDRPTPLGEALIDEVSTMIYPERATRAIAELIRNRAMRRRVTLVCLNCTRGIMRSISELRERPSCPRCSSLSLALCRDLSRAQALLAREHPTPGDKVRLRRLRLNADLVRSFGRRAVIALSARGVGETTAARILGRSRLSEEDFFMDLAEAEVTYERTRRFWG